MAKKEFSELMIEIILLEEDDVLMASGFDGVGEYDPDAVWE